MQHHNTHHCGDIIGLIYKREKSGFSPSIPIPVVHLHLNAPAEEKKRKECVKISPPKNSTTYSVCQLKELTLLCGPLCQ